MLKPPASSLQPPGSAPPPCAHGAPCGRAVLRATPEDFIVREWLGFAPEGEGEHMMLTVRKRGANTMWVAKQLARLAKVHPSEVGFAGLKDRDAVAEQAFTLPVRSALGEQWDGVRGEGFEVLQSARCRRKLKRGALRGNAFEIVLREFVGERPALEARLQAIARGGVPSYFGPQRFGRDGRNVDLAHRWFSGESAAPDRLERGFALSAARALIFNAVLAQRVQDGSWNQLQPGDVANLEGSGSIFSIDAVDATLSERCERLDIHPTGPLWGAGALSSAGEVQALEAACAAQLQLFSDGLAQAGLEQERRALRIAVHDLEWTFEQDALRLRFRLTRGAFATAVLHELVADVFASDATESIE